MLESIVSFDKSKNFDLIDDTMMIPEEEQQCTKTSGEKDDTDEFKPENTLGGGSSLTKNKKMEKLGKVHLTK